MDFKNIPIQCYPVYSWQWNGKITKEEIKRQIDEMYDMGIRAFYVLAMPANFRPNYQRTYLEPEYLSKEYIELVYYAYCLAEEKGMYTWLYNEGGWPSGMACGKIRKNHPKLARKNLVIKKIILPANQVYVPSEQCIVSFVGEKKILPGDSFMEEIEVTEYVVHDMGRETNLTDTATRENTKYFLEYTHEALKATFGEHMGKEVKIMFDDEATMGSWTQGLDDIFREQFGYEMEDYVPYIVDELPAMTKEQYKAKSDYNMLCGELLCNHYFIPMREWLNGNQMLSLGHLDCDNLSDGAYIKRYGNLLHMLRQFDIPGIDAIWGQITYPDDDKREGNLFFPRLASSAARQQGHSVCMSESFAVYGAHVTPEEMRYVVNYQAVRGISLYNFMTISYDRKTAAVFQFRPGFHKENPGVDCLDQINHYVARLSYILQESKADVRTALYFPFRSICAGGKVCEETIRAFEELGNMLEEKGVSFDLIDEAFVSGAMVKNGVLKGEYVSYENVFVPDTTSVLTESLEPKEILEKLSHTGKALTPCIKRKNQNIAARKVLFENKREGYFICNLGNDMLEETVSIYSDKTPVLVDLYSGELYHLDCVQKKDEIDVPLKLSRGEGIMIMLQEEPVEGNILQKFCQCRELLEFESYVSRRYEIHPQSGPLNIYYEDGERSRGLLEWPKNFSGEVTYLTKLPLAAKECMLDLGEVRHIAKVYLNGKKVGKVTMPPYQIKLSEVQSGDELRIIVGNTIANVCHDAAFFESQDPREVGPYHKNMTKQEAKAPAGGLLGPVKIYMTDL